MLVETFTLCLLFAGAGWVGLLVENRALVLTAAILQGFWLQRMYCVGHEAAHEKLFPAHPRWNDIFGQIALFSLPVPLPIFKAIHRFHHAHNRRDAETSALDVFRLSKRSPRLSRFYGHLSWYAAVFAGGWFIHGLFSILFFLFLPLRVARKISPAFRHWTRRLQLTSIGLFAIPVLGQAALASVAGTEAWLWLLFVPLCVFAWVYSVQLYVYHYRTTLGPKTHLHARRLPGNPVISWWLLNLNHHDTHHRFTKVPWYQLPTAGKPLPVTHAHNQNVDTFSAGILQQLRGATLVEDP